MSMESGIRFRMALVRPPSETFADGITTAALGAPDVSLALRQHGSYCAALERLGLRLVPLPADSTHPDSTFVEDVAIVTPQGAILCRPGAPSRLGEVEAMRAPLERAIGKVATIEAPGTVDGGDVCQADERFFIGVSRRTNEAGARQLAAWLGELGYACTLVDIRDDARLLHLKSGLAWLGGKDLVVVEWLASHPAFAGYRTLAVPRAELYAANCVRVNDSVLIAEGFPALARRIEELGYRVVPVDVSEFRKMDGGLSCLSLRLP